MTEDGQEMERVLARLEPTPGRRVLAVAMMFTLGVILIAVGLTQAGVLVARLALIVLGAGAMVLGDRVRRATALALVLTETELRDSRGRLLVSLDRIRRVERGIFAFKPSNGFLLHLDTPAPRSWAPGLYWSRGRVIGVGGAVSAGAAKAMAELIALRIAGR